MQVSSGVDDPCKDLNINICDSAWTAKVFEIFLRILVSNLLRVVHDTLVVRYIRDVKTKQGQVLDVGGPRPMQWWMPDAEAHSFSRMQSSSTLFRTSQAGFGHRVRIDRAWVMLGGV